MQTKSWNWSQRLPGRFSSDGVLLAWISGGWRSDRTRAAEANTHSHKHRWINNNASDSKTEKFKSGPKKIPQITPCSLVTLWLLNSQLFCLRYPRPVHMTWHPTTFVGLQLRILVWGATAPSHGVQVSWGLVLGPAGTWLYGPGHPTWPGSASEFPRRSRKAPLVRRRPGTTLLSSQRKWMDGVCQRRLCYNQTTSG